METMGRVHDMGVGEFLKCLKAGGRVSVHVRTEFLSLT
jgi:hypothetical protein